MDMWGVVVREECRDTMARYNHAGDRLRLVEMSETFTEDGVLELKGRSPLVGRAAIVDFIGGVPGSSRTVEGRPAATVAATDRPFVRHSVASIHFESVTPDEVRVASYFTVTTEVGPDHTGRYHDRLVPVGDRWLFAHRLVTTEWWAPDSRFRRPT